MITPGELWFGRTAGTQVRLSSRRICRGGALSPPAVHGLMDVLYGPTDMSARTRSVAEGTTCRHTGAPPAVRSNGPMWSSAPTDRRGSFSNHPGQRRTAERLRRGWEERVKIGAEIIPKVFINAGQSLSQPAADSSLSTREPLRTEDADRRVASLLAMTVLILCHSEEAQRADVGIRPFLRWTGVWAAEVIGPYGRSTEAPATGRCGHRPLRKAQSTTQASRRAAKRPRPRPRGMGGNRCKDHPKRGTAAATAEAALSEAESAGIVAGQIQFLPDK